MIFADEVGGRFEPVHIGLRQALAQVAQIAFEEHRILRTPDEQRRLVEGGDVLADALEFGIGGMSAIDGDIGDEVADRPPVLCPPVRGTEGVLGPGIEVTQGEGDAQEIVGEHGGRRQHGPGQGRAQWRGHRGVLGLVDGRVEADRRGHPVGVPGGPAE